MTKDWRQVDWSAQTLMFVHEEAFRTEDIGGGKPHRLASENPLREYWQGFVVDDCTMHLDVGVVTLKEPENTGGGTPRSVHFLLTSLCADWRSELHADLLTDIQRDVKEVSNAEYQEYLAFRARFEGE